MYIYIYICVRVRACVRAVVANECRPRESMRTRVSKTSYLVVFSPIYAWHYGQTSPVVVHNDVVCNSCVTLFPLGNAG